MRLINKNKEPKSLVEYRTKGGTFGDFSLDKGKRDLKNRLLSEQSFLCAYCTQSIKFETMKVEHWYPQSNPKQLSPNRDLDYSNLFAVCKGCFGHEEHCDTNKGNKIISILPTDTNHIAQIYYKNGSINSINTKHNQDLNCILKLNINALVKQRKQVLSTFKLEIHKRYSGRRANFRQLLENWKKKNIPHQMVVVSYLEYKNRK